MKKIILSFLAILTFLPVAVAYAAYTGPGDRTLPGGTSCDIVLRYCTFIRGRWVWNAETSWSCGNQSEPWQAWPKLSGSCTAAREGQYGWEEERRPGDPITYAPVSISHTLTCTTPGNSGWCRDGLSLNLSANETIPGHTVRFFEASSGILCDPDDAATVYCATPITQQGSGSNAYWAVSSYGDTSLQNTYSWALDSVVPALSHFASGWLINGWHTANLTLNLSGADATSGINPSSYRYRLNGGAWQNGASLSITVDAVYDIDAEVQDVAGNSGGRTVTIRLDKTPPTTSPVANGAQQNGWFRSAVEVAANAADATSGVATVEHRINGGAWQPGGNATVSTDGAHTVAFQVTDQAGHVTVREISFSVDRTPPTLSATPAPDGLNGWYVTSPNIPLSALDALSGVAPGSLQYRWNSLDWTPGDVVTVSQDGIHLIEAQVQDLAGNDADAAFEVRVDTVAPSLNIDVASDAPMQNGWHVAPATATAFATDQTSGVEMIEYQVSATVASARAGRFSILPQSGWVEGSTLTLEDGDHLLRMRVRDVAGHLSDTSQRIRVDTLAPVSAFLPVNGPLSGLASLPGTSVDVTSGVARVEYSLDDSTTWQAVSLSEETWSIPYDTTLRPDGDYEILVRAIDQAGNVEDPRSLSVTVNNAPPKVSISESWWIWESGQLAVRPGVAPLGDIRLQIECESLPDVLLDFKELDKLPGEFTWNRRCGDGTLAEPGEYKVTLTACNIFGKCASGTGVIQIPDGLTSIQTATPQHTLTSSPTPTRSAPTPTATSVPVVSSPAEAAIEEVPAQVRWPLWSLPLAGLLGMVLAVGVNHVRDPRPRAIRRIAGLLGKAADE